MRKSVRQNDPGYDPRAFQYKVYLDGKELDGCHTADEEQGIAIVIDGFDGDKPIDKTLTGKVVLVPPGRKGRLTRGQAP